MLAMSQLSAWHDVCDELDDRERGKPARSRGLVESALSEVPVSTLQPDSLQENTVLFAAWLTGIKESLHFKVLGDPVDRHACVSCTLLGKHLDERSWSEESRQPEAVDGCEVLNLDKACPEI